MIAALYGRKSTRHGSVVGMLCCLLVLATSASAECAWVLWVTSMEGPNKWSVVQSFSSLPECKAEIYRHFGELGVAIGKDYAYMWKCFPGTIDPREPK